MARESLTESALADIQDLIAKQQTARETHGVYDHVFGGLTKLEAVSAHIAGHVIVAILPHDSELEKIGEKVTRIVEIARQVLEECKRCESPPPAKSVGGD